MEEARIEVYGRVQGVRFRQYVKECAYNHNIKGFVRNLDDGSVLIIAQAKKEDLNEFIYDVQKGNALSNISGMSYSLTKDSEVKFDCFDIEREKNIILDQKKSFKNLLSRMFNRKTNIPNHVAIIPDGNRRWAKEKGLKASVGHYTAGSYDSVEKLFREAENLGVKYMSIWAFSTENWNRSKEEIDAVFRVVLKGVERFRKNAHINKIRFRHLGRIDRVPKNLAKEIKKLEEETKRYDKFNVQLCLDYGGRDELIRAVNKIIKDGKKKISEKVFGKYLDSNGIPEPDLIIRTSGEKRLSGFMPFQSSYSELYFTDKYFPDFKGEDLRKAIEVYSYRKRNFGK